MHRRWIFGRYSHKEGTGAIVDSFILRPAGLSLSPVLANFHRLLIVSAFRLLSLCALLNPTSRLWFCVPCVHVLAFCTGSAIFLSQVFWGMCTSGGSARRTYLLGFTTERIGKVLGGTFHTQTSSFLFQCTS